MGYAEHLNRSEQKSVFSAQRISLALILSWTSRLDSRGSSNARAREEWCVEKQLQLYSCCIWASMSSKSCNDKRQQFTDRKPCSPVSLPPLTRPRFGKFNSNSLPTCLILPTTVLTEPTASFPITEPLSFSGFALQSGCARPRLARLLLEGAVRSTVPGFQIHSADPPTNMTVACKDKERES